MLVSDLMQIQQVQGQRQRRHAKRNANQSRIVAAKHNANKKSNVGMTSTTTASTVAEVVQRKKLLSKRY